MDYKKQNIPDYINVSTMAKMLYISRSRLYQLIEEGILLKPLRVEKSKRPVYSRKMIIRNLEVKKNNVGVNGTIIMFYAQRSNPNVKSVSKPSMKQPVQENYKALIDDLELIGLPDISMVDVESAIKICFPNGTDGVSEDEILTVVFRHLKRQNTEHKPRT